MAKWLEFQEMQTSTKTKVFFVWNKEKSTLIGEVRWYGPWRQYAFMPAQNTVWERQCLMDIARFINNLMVERKKLNQLQKQQL